MTAFQSRWDEWEPKGPRRGTAKTDKSPSVSSVSAPPRSFADEMDPSDPQTGASPSMKESQEAPSSLTDITDKSLPQAFKPTTVKADERSQPERVVLLAVPPGVPETWTQGVADLLALPRPASCPEARWNVLREDAYHFLRGHAAQAHALDWTEYDLFGVHPERPWARFDCMGLVPVLDSARVTALSDTAVVIEKPNGSRVTFHRRGQVADETCLVWSLR